MISHSSRLTCICVGIDRQATNVTPEYQTRKATPTGQAFNLFPSLALAVTSVTPVDVVADPDVLWGEIKRLSTCARFLYRLPL